MKNEIDSDLAVVSRLTDGTSTDFMTAALDILLLLYYESEPNYSMSK